MTYRIEYFRGDFQLPSKICKSENDAIKIAQETIARHGADRAIIREMANGTKIAVVKPEKA